MSKEIPVSAHVLRDQLVTIVRRITTGSEKAYGRGASYIETQLNRRLEHYDGDYEADMERLIAFANNAAATLPRGYALKKITKEIDEILRLYEDHPEEQNNVNPYASTGGGKRVIRGTNSLT